MLILTRKKEDHDIERQHIISEAKNFLEWEEDFSLEVYQVYEIDHVSEEEGRDIIQSAFDREIDDLLTEFPEINEDLAFRYHQVPGQYDENQDMLEQFIHSVLGYSDAEVSHSQMIVLEEVEKAQAEELKAYLLNPVETEEIEIHASKPAVRKSDTEDLQAIEGFRDFSEEELKDFGKDYSMDEADMALTQAYFREEGRDPNTTELKVIDTYWSDHCRHTTFNTQIDRIEIEEGPFNALYQAALNDYLTKRERLERTDRPVTLMDMGTIQAKNLMIDGKLPDVEVSAEVNAAALEIKVDVDGSEEDWILYFKNETHNHPTEIEPFGGSSTCVGGGIRDPLSGRSWVYQAMRISGAKNPTLSKEETREGKLPQRTISKASLDGNSDYANQYGLTGAYARELYHDGFEAKRLEVGALIAAAPRENVVREEPLAGDKIILLGGRTGRDGLGAAVGSSMIQTEESLETAGAEVQKGAPSVQRKISRLFRRGEATKLIKRSNDFGAGGVSVAVGELTPGLVIDLDKVPLKYEGLHGGEIALSESQERMAVVVSDEDVEKFLDYAREEDVEASIIAEVTDTHYMTMTWEGEEIVNLKREFLDSNGAEKHAMARLEMPTSDFLDNGADIELDKEGISDYIAQLNRASQQAMGERYDSTVGRATVLFPYGGEERSTPELGMVSRLPVAGGKTDTVSGMAYGYHPDLASDSPYHGGYYAVIDSISRMVAMGFDYKDTRLTFQEYFERLYDVPERWGKPVLALLGANDVMDGLEIGSIGGKDSMSGSFEELDVPPTLISFAVAKGNIQNITSRAFKQAGSDVVLLESPITEEGTLDLEKTSRLFGELYEALQAGSLLSVSSVGYDGMLKELIEMSFGNNISLEVKDEVKDRLTEFMMGSFLVEVSPEQDLEVIFEGSDYALIGQTQKENLTVNGQDISIRRLQEASEGTLASVYENIEKTDQELAASASAVFEGEALEEAPRALIPVLLGNNAEYDMRDALLAEGIPSKQTVIKSSTHEAFEASLREFLEALKEANILVLPGGSVFGNELGARQTAWQTLFARSDVQEAVHAHLEKKRVIFGTGSGFQALIKSGLIEFGEIREGSSIRILPNPKGKFLSDLLEAEVISERSLFTKELQEKSYSTAFATRNGRIDLGDRKEELYGNGQVVSVYKEYMAEENIDAMSSPEGLVFGSLGHFERMDDALYKNVQTKTPGFIRQLKAYFNKEEK